MNNKDISKIYIELINILNNDDMFIFYYYTCPFSILEYIVPKYYLIQRYNELIKKGKLKIKGADKNE